jgi:hypothetical protein
MYGMVKELSVLKKPAFSVLSTLANAFRIEVVLRKDQNLAVFTRLFILCAAHHDIASIIKNHCYNV